MNFTTVILRTHVSHVTVYSQNKDHSHIVHTYQKQILMRIFFVFHCLQMMHVAQVELTLITVSNKHIKI